jgi:hypothetical protein
LPSRIEFLELRSFPGQAPGVVGGAVARTSVALIQDQLRAATFEQQEISHAEPGPSRAGHSEHFCASGPLEPDTGSVVSDSSAGLAIDYARGEGFGLPIAEAMACGLPVIVTGYGAALDFYNEDNAYLIPAQVVRLPSKVVGDLETIDFPWLAEPTLEKHEKKGGSRDGLPAQECPLATRPGTPGVLVESRNAAFFGGCRQRYRLRIPSNPSLPI